MYSLQFLAVFLNASYKENMTTRISFIIIGVIKSLLFLINFLSLINPSVLNCSKKNYMCRHFHPSKFYSNTIPMIICSLISFSVSIYVVKVAKNLSKNSIAPIQVSNISQNVEKTQESLEQIPSSHVTVGRKDFIKHQSIERRTSDPVLFFKTEKLQVIYKSFVPNQSGNVLKFVKTNEKVNLISLYIICLMIPSNILKIFVFATGKSCSFMMGHDAIFRAGLISEFFFLLMYPYLVKRKLDHF